MACLWKHPILLVATRLVATLGRHGAPNGMHYCKECMPLGVLRFVSVSLGGLPCRGS